jgi:hypothetical protein
MDHLPNLHLLAGHRSELCCVLNVALAHFTHIRLWGAVPPPRDVLTGDLVVVDLSDPPLRADPGSLEVFVRHGASVCLVLGDSLVAPSWVEIARVPGVRVLRCGNGHEPLGYGAVVTALLERVRGPTGERIATLVF